MLIKIISPLFSYSLLIFVNHSFKPAYTSDCEEHLSRRAAIRVKEMFRKKRAIKKLEKLSQKKLTLKILSNRKLHMNYCGKFRPIFS
mgnify:CR=1 FL=1